MRARTGSAPTWPMALSRPSRSRRRPRTPATRQGRFDEPGRPSSTARRLAARPRTAVGMAGPMSAKMTEGAEGVQPKSVAILGIFAKAPKVTISPEDDHLNVRPGHLRPNYSTTTRECVCVCVCVCVCEGGHLWWPTRARGKTYHCPSAIPAESPTKSTGLTGPDAKPRPRLPAPEGPYRAQNGRRAGARQVRDASRTRRTAGIPWGDWMANPVCFARCSPCRPWPTTAPCRSGRSACGWTPASSGSCDSLAVWSASSPAELARFLGAARD